VNLRTNAQIAPPSAMAQSLIRLMVIIAFGSFSTTAVHSLPIIARSGKAWSGSFVATGFFLVFIATIATGAFYYALKKLVPFIDASAQAQAGFLDTLNAKYVDAAILYLRSAQSFSRALHHKMAILGSSIFCFL
jgi:hypothetical protein